MEFRNRLMAVVSSLIATAALSAELCAQTNPAPGLGSISPSVIDAGSPSTTVTLTGSGFVASSVVRVNGTDFTSVFVDSTTLSIVLPAVNLSTPGFLSIVVFNPLWAGSSRTNQGAHT